MIKREEELHKATSFQKEVVQEKESERLKIMKLHGIRDDKKHSNLLTTTFGRRIDPKTGRPFEERIEFGNSHLTIANESNNNLNTASTGKYHNIFTICIPILF